MIWKDIYVYFRQSTVQEIPVFNNDPKDWILHSTFADEPSKSLLASSPAFMPCFFTGPSSVIVPAKQHVNYPLVYHQLIQQT